MRTCNRALWWRRFSRFAKRESTRRNGRALSLVVPFIDLEIELTKANLPFVKYGGFKFIETAHVKDMIAYLRVLENPRDVVSWNRILMLIDGVGPRTAETVTDDIMNKRLLPSADGRETIVSEKFWQDYHAYPAGVQKLF